jgi:hypothetical protein
MRMALVVLALVLVAGCSTSGGDDGAARADDGPETVPIQGPQSASAEGAKLAVLTNMRRSANREWELLYGSLHPDQQEIVTRDEFVRCSERRIISLPQDAEYMVVATANERVTIAGTTTEADATLLTVEASWETRGFPGSGSFTESLVYVDGTWRWLIGDVDFYRDC